MKQQTARVSALWKSYCARRAAFFEGGEKTPLPRHRVRLAVFLLVFALCNGLIALRLTAGSYSNISPARYWASYTARPVTMCLNLLPAVLFMAFGCFLTRRPWAAQLFSSTLTLGMALANFFKVQLRGDPLIATDVRLLRTASGVVGFYTPTWTPAVYAALEQSALLLALVFLLLPLRVRLAWKPRLGGAAACVLLAPLLYSQVFMNMYLYGLSDNPDAIDNRWSEVEVFLSRGFWYPFVRSIHNTLRDVPQGYSRQMAQVLLDDYETADIPPERKVNVCAVMLEAFSDLSDFPELARYPELRAVYSPLHTMEQESVSGRLLTNIFAGGTVDSEWGFLTGYTRHGLFRADLDSYVYYFNSQGYQTLYRHPGHSWFYNRNHITEYLGFQDIMFSESGFQELVDVDRAPRHSDHELFTFLLSELASQTEQSQPMFSFSVSYQNHGPYDDDSSPAYFIREDESGLSEESVNILNQYLYGIQDTLNELQAFRSGLEELDEPVVLVVFGDHKPWLGNDMSVYLEAGVNIEPETLEGFRGYYGTPWFIWANAAAKERLGSDFCGDGGEFSPCFLMPALFDCCGWDGPAFMGLARDLRARTPLVHAAGLFLENGVLTEELSPENKKFYQDYRCAEYWRESRGLSVYDD